MKHKSRFVTTIFLSSTIFVVLGCQIASQAVPTTGSEPVSTSMPGGQPTQTLPPTQNPEPDISSAVLKLDDLPSGFEEFNPEELGMSIDDFSDEDFKPEEVFIFLNSQDFQMIFGFNFLLTERFDRAAFDISMSQPEMTLPALVNGMGSENIQDEKVLEGFEDIGEAQIGMTMIANM